MRLAMHSYCLKMPPRRHSQWGSDGSLHERTFEKVYRDTMRRIPGLKPRGYLHTGLLRTYRTEAAE